MMILIDVCSPFANGDAWDVIDDDVNSLLGDV